MRIYEMCQQLQAIWAQRAARPKPPEPTIRPYVAPPAKPKRTRRKAADR